MAGAVYAAAVILPKDFKNELLNDSKQLTEKQRYALREVIETEAIAWAVGIVSPEEIDEINILRASFLAMHRAVDQLTTRPQHLLIDGNRFTKYPGVPHTTVVKGDGKYLSIAAASILAKTYRDDYMNRLHEEFPYYDWDHKKDSESAPQTTVADELKENLEAVENFKGSRDEKLVVLYCKQLGINYKNLSDKEFRWLIRILQKSKKTGTPISQRKKR